MKKFISVIVLIFAILIFANNISFAQISKKDIDKARHYCELGSSALDKKDYNEARKYIDKAIELNPNFAKAYCSRGFVKAIILKDYHGALADFNKAKDIASSADPELYLILIQMLKELENEINRMSTK